MTRDLRSLADTRFDVVIVGAGFYGAIAAWDAALRGLSVALIDKGDFGAATSFNNHKTLHGGLRSLQTMNFAQMRLFIRERRALARVAPHLVRPMPFVVPTYRHPKRSATLMRAALAINDTVARDRHQGLNDPALRLPPSEVLSRDACLQLNPVIDPAGVTGGALWHDYQMHNTDRMTFSFVLSAAGAGATAANHVMATGVLRDGARVSGVRAVDRLTSTPFDIQAHTVVNAAGPWAASFLETLESRVTPPATRLSRAMNVVTRSVGIKQGCGGLTRGRFLFLIPWRDVALLGTSHDPYDAAPDRLQISERDVQAFMADAREAFPGARLSVSDVRLVHRGLLPTVASDDAGVKLLRESAVVDHRHEGVPGLISIFGVRYTTARHTAARAVDAIYSDRGNRTPPKDRTGEVPVFGGAIPDKERFLADVVHRDGNDVSPETLRRLAMTYGTTYDKVLQVLRERADLAEPLGTRCSVTGGEIVYAARAEAAVKLSDAVIRRTEAGSAGHPGDDAVRCAAVLMAQELGWDERKIAEEIADTDDFYRWSVS